MEGDAPTKARQSLFSLSEIAEMESVLEEAGERSLERDFCQDLASKLSSSAIRAGKAAVTWKEVQDWFKSKLRGAQDEIDSKPLAWNLIVDLSDSTFSTPSNESLPNPAGSKVMDLSEVAFEAKSQKDYAWYDVASVLSYRITHSGELEARVRFSGFSKDQDEWINVRTSIRERSIPLEPSECHKIHVGDLTLCFQERSHQAVYCDAHVLAIDRKEHDASSCTCLFLVRYDQDDSEEEVDLSRICSRPLPEKMEPPQVNVKPDALSISARSLWE
ncbi:hypothetical protein MLD38_030706 [Melastoma candidum]|uniref:Uncharacterized protein n=1 Tax=Melastoma candidum TaxID=119954 RepID=A0ACB9MPD2_9MYRT|nr:hypothetical protein MLD38_030706 [Melastoma candidum]